MRRRLSRRDFVGFLGAGAATVALAGVPGCGPGRPSQSPSPEERATSGTLARRDVRSFRTRPELRPPAIEVTRPARGVAPGYIFVVPDRGPGQYGPLILDDSGKPGWFPALAGQARAGLPHAALAEETGVILGIGAWAVPEASRQAARWRGARNACGTVEAAGTGFVVGVNVSARQLSEPGFHNALLQALYEAGPRCILCGRRSGTPP